MCFSGCGGASACSGYCVLGFGQDPSLCSRAQVEEVAAEPESAEPGADGSAGQEGAPEGEVDQHAEQDAEGHAEGHAEGYEGGEDPGAAPPPAEDGEGEEGGEGAAPVDGEQQEAAAEGEGQPGEGAEGEGSAEAAGGEGGEEGAAAEGQPAEGEGAAEGEAAPEEEAGPPPPPPPPPYVPPEVGDDYVPVADLPPLPEPVGRTEEGKACPLPGVESLFITGGKGREAKVCVWTSARLATGVLARPSWALRLSRRACA